MLGRMPQAALEKAGPDPRYLALYRRACEHYDAYMQNGTGARRRMPSPTSRWSTA